MQTQMPRQPGTEQTGNHPQQTRHPIKRELSLGIAPDDEARHQSRQTESSQCYWKSCDCRMENHRSHYQRTTDWSGLGKESCSCSCCIQCCQSYQRTGMGWSNSYDCNHYKNRVWNSLHSNYQSHPSRGEGWNSSYCCSSCGHNLRSHSRDTRTYRKRRVIEQRRLRRTGG